MTDVDKKAVLDAKNAAYKVIFDLVNESGKKEAKEAMMLIRPSLYGIRVGGSSACDEFVAQFAEVGTAVREIDIFNNTGAGRKECATHIKRALKKANPEDRKWVLFNVDKREYVLIGIGANPPAEWTGYVPTEVDVEELA